MNNSPTISVIVPNYNYARYLKQRIDSILAQTYTDYELILLDDASTDNSKDILNSYQNNPHVSCISINEKNTGSPFKQWMKGIHLAKGKWIWIAEADDLSQPNFLETCINALQTDSKAVACYVGSIFIDTNGEEIPQEANYWGKPSKSLHSFNGRLFAEHNLYWSCCISNTSSALFKREVALNLPNQSFTSLRYAGDWLFWFQMTLQGNIIEIYQNLNLFRQHQSKVTETGKRLGNGIVEDIYVTQYMESQLTLSSYKRKLSHGLIYRKIKKAHITEDKRNMLFDLLDKELQGNYSDFMLTRRNRILRFIFPNLLTLKRDRLKPI